MSNEVTLSRLLPQTTQKEIRKSLKSDFPEVQCEALQFKYPDYYSSYKVIIDLVNKEKAMDLNRWPQGTYVSQFFHRNM